MGQLDYAMVVVTAAAEGRRGGCLVGFTTQCSVEPPRFVVYVSKKNRTYAIAEQADALGVHFLESSDRDLAELFGGETGDETDKFEALAWHEAAGGVPVIDRCPNRFVGRVVDRCAHDDADHVGFVLAPIEVNQGPSLEPLMFQDVKELDPGHDA